MAEAWDSGFIVCTFATIVFVVYLFEWFLNR